MRFADKVVLVTGASSGIGRTTAIYFAKEGASLAITGRNEDNLRSVAAECFDKGAKDVLEILVEFEDLDAVAKIIEKVEDKFNTLHILVNNAGALKPGSLASVTLQDIDYHFGINVKSMIILTQKAMPILVRTKGCVINVSSVCGQGISLPQCLCYGMSKSAVDYFTKAIALEYAAKGVRVNSVNPSMVKTNILRHIDDPSYDGATKFHPIGRIGETDDVARAIIFLASEDSSWITGDLLTLDGGRSLLAYSSLPQ